MNCPFCEGETRVTNKRDAKGEVKRRRECLSCKKRFTTYESFKSPALTVLKKDGNKEKFEADKIREGIKQACLKRPSCISNVDSIVARIQAKLQASGKKIIPSAIIGALILRELKKIDHIGYVRFASVYHEFEDPKDFHEELERLG